MSKSQPSSKKHVATTIDPIPTYPEIIISLQLMDTEGPRFHWSLFIPDGNSNSVHGTKFHAIQALEESCGWRYDRTAFEIDISVVAAAVIGHLEETTQDIEGLDALLREIPMEIPAVDTQKEPRWSCRVWLREALRRLHDAGYIQCPNVDAMEEEMWEYGRNAAQEIDAETFKIAKLFRAKNSR